MELIHAKEAYANTLIAKSKARRIMFEDLALCFNKYVNEAAARAETAILLRWRDFDIGDIIYGIQLGDKIICACCGGIFPIDELNELARESLCTNWVKVSKDWISFADEMAYKW